MRSGTKICVVGWRMAGIVGPAESLRALISSIVIGVSILVSDEKSNNLQCDGLRHNCAGGGEVL